MKKVLAINYSQTGQLNEIMESILGPLRSEFSVDRIHYAPRNGFSFPWTPSSFFDAMPEAVLNKGVEVEAFQIPSDKYDLVILGYQPWFLSMSQPTAGLFKYEKFKEVLKNTPIVTVIGARNMWINAQEDVRAEIRVNDAKLVGNIPLIDKNSNLMSAVSIMHWMFTGRKDKKWNLFPVPGISPDEIKGASQFGEVIARSLKNNDLSGLQDELRRKGKFDIGWNILFIEARAKKLFRIWAHIIVKKGTTPEKRKNWLVFFKYYLLFALFIVSPIVLLIYTVFFRVFSLDKEKRKREMTLGVA